MRGMRCRALTFPGQRFLHLLHLSHALCLFRHLCSQLLGDKLGAGWQGGNTILVGVWLIGV